MRLIRERVVHEAQGLLDQTTRSLTDIAAEVGFDSLRTSAACSPPPPEPRRGRHRTRPRAKAEERGRDRGFADWP